MKSSIEVDLSENVTTLNGDDLVDDDTIAAIVAALEIVFSQPRLTISKTLQRSKFQAWRFSGRWWARPIPMVRDRPY